MPISAEQELLAKAQTRTTPLSSAGISQEWPTRIKNEALFSARTTSQSYIDMVKKRLLAVASGNISPDTAEKQLQQCLEILGYTPQTGFPDNNGKVPPATPKSIQDLSSAWRINLILDTNIKRARSMGQMAASESPVFMRTNPAWHLTRTGARKKPRGDWKTRWNAAGASVGWKGASKGRFVALKNSPIWEALGKGAGGYKDALGSPFPPFAFGSGLAWVNVSRKEWESICKAEGIDTGLGDIDAKAATSQKQPPEESPFAGGISREDGIVALKALRDRLKQRKTNTPTPLAVVSAIDASAKDITCHAILRALGQIHTAKKQVADIAKEMATSYSECKQIARTAPEYDNYKRILIFMSKYDSAIADAAKTIDENQERAIKYYKTVKRTPLPTDRAKQTSFDQTMKRYQGATERVTRDASIAESTALRNIKAARIIAEKMRHL